MTRCLEVALVMGGTLAIRGRPESWEPVTGTAKAVERMRALDRWGEFSALYRVESDTGRTRHYMVAEG